MQILLTGGAGYIGSHTVIELDKAGHEVIVLDNFCKSILESLNRVTAIIGKQVPFFKAYIRDRKEIDIIFNEYQIDTVIHFAGHKAVGESVTKSLEYFENNMSGTFVLLDVIRKHDCKNLIFSCFATVYGNSEITPITEECPKGYCTNPYGQTKSMLEEVLIDIKRLITSKTLFFSVISIQLVLIHLVLWERILMVFLITLCLILRRLM